MNKTLNIAGVPAIVALLFFATCSSSVAQQESSALTVRDDQKTVTPEEVVRQFEAPEMTAYTLGDGDEITVDVWNHAELSGHHVIGPDGKITIPISGTLKVSELTRDEAQKTIAAALSRYYSDLSVTLRVDRYTSYRVYLLGRAGNPGMLQFDTQPTLLDVVTRAAILQSTSGGVTTPPLGRCAILRGRDQMVWVDLQALLSQGNLALNIRLQRNDVVYLRDASDRVVYVLGEVKRPGAYQLTPTMSFLDAYSQAGGSTEDASDDKIELIRSSSGAQREFRLKDLLSGPGQLNLALQEGGHPLPPSTQPGQIRLHTTEDQPDRFLCCTRHACRRGITVATLSSAPPEPTTASLVHGSPPPAGTSSSSGISIHPLASLRRHPTAALIAAILFLLAGLAAAWRMGTPKYSATAVIYVSPRFIANLADNNSQKFDSMEQYREYVQQNVRTINRFDILIAALERLGPMKSIWVKPGETLDRAAARLQGALTIEAIPDTYQIAISLDGKTRAGLAELVNSVADAYLDKAKSEEFFDSDQRVRSLLADRARLQKDIADKQARRMVLAQELGVSSFTDSDLNPYDRLLVTAKEAQSEAQKDAIQAETQLAVFDEKQHPGATQALHAFALGEANKDTVLSSTISNLNSRRAQVQASLSGLSADHPGRRSAEHELTEIDRERQAAIQTEVDSLSRMILEQRTAQAYQARRMEQQLTQEVDRHSAQAAWFTRGYQEGIQLGLDVDEARKSNDSIQQRIDYFMLEKNAPGFVRLFSAARIPDQPVKGGTKALRAFGPRAGDGHGGGGPCGHRLP